MSPSDAKLVRRLKRSRVAVQARRILFKIPKFDSIPHVWTRKKEALLGKMTDPKLAARLGISVLAVAHRRRRLGIPARYAHRRLWTPKEDALLGTDSDTEIAARLDRAVERLSASAGKNWGFQIFTGNRDSDGSENFASA